MIEADAALRRLAQDCIGNFGISHAMPRDFPQFLFLDGIADANIHEGEV